MEIKPICEYKYIFHTIKKTIYLPVELKDIPDELTLGEFTLLKRAEFHVSLVCIKQIVDRYMVKIPDFEIKIIDDFCEFTKINDIKVLNYKNEFKLVTKENKKTLVVMCEMLNLNKFFDFVNKKHSLQIEYPPAHVTLHTLDGKAGIFLISDDDIKNFTVPIPDPIGHSL